jgi:malonyl-CoA/methylmalonyl-CoA synthetase
MRLFVSGSAPLSAHVLEAFREKYGHTILERYGMSETLMIMSNPYAGERRAGTVGFPLPGVSVKLMDGEIYLKGPNVFAGYWRREPHEGWFRTGDLATRSDDGYYTLSGRKSDLIISGGFNIYPREIEEFLEEQPEIAEAAVVAQADRVRGEVPVAYVVVRGACELAAIEARCKEKMASFKVPKEFRIIDKLPRNALGKIQKHLLGVG